MYAFYSLLVYIFYTVFKKEEEEEDALEGACGASSAVCLATSYPASGGNLLGIVFVFCEEHVCVTDITPTYAKRLSSIILK